MTSKVGLNPGATEFKQPKKNSSQEKSAVGLRPEAAPYVAPDQPPPVHVPGLSPDAQAWVPPKGKGKKGKGKGKGRGGAQPNQQQQMLQQQFQAMQQMQQFQMQQQMAAMMLMNQNAAAVTQQMNMMRIQQQNQQQVAQAVAALNAMQQQAAAPNVVSGVPLSAPRASPGKGGYQSAGAQAAKPKMTKHSADISVNASKEEQTTRLHTASAPARDFSEGPTTGTDLLKAATGLQRKKA